jgi:hypothetical protein
MSTPSPDEGDHMVHALGITALLRTHNSPLGLVADFARGSLNGFMERGLLNPPNAAGGPAEESLDNMTLELFSVFTEYEVLLGKMRAAGPPDPWRLRRLFRETQGGFDKIMQWQRTQRILDPAQFAGIAGDSLVERAHGCVFWPGRIDVYKDRKPTNAESLSRNQR